MGGPLISFLFALIPDRQCGPRMRSFNRSKRGKQNQTTLHRRATTAGIANELKVLVQGANTAKEKNVITNAITRGLLNELTTRSAYVRPTGSTTAEVPLDVCTLSFCVACDTSGVGAGEETDLRPTSRVGARVSVRVTFSSPSYSSIVVRRRMTTVTAPRPWLCGPLSTTLMP